MNGIILAGGFAKRLMPISEFIPKPLLPIDGRPLLDIIIDKIKEIDTEKIVISINKRFEKEFNFYLKCRNDENLKILVEPTMREEEKFGAVKGILYAMENSGDNDYLVVAGDNYFDFNLKPFYEFAIKNNKITIVGYDIENIELSKNYGVFSLENNKIKNFVEKPEKPFSSIVSTGIYYFPKDSVDLIKKYLMESENKDQIGKLIQWLINKTDVYAVVLKGKWVDIGNLDIYRELYNSFLP
ncbi:MAG: nucleotidyltransferase family protein [Thermoplasmata archaeon]|jgi:glucose-1-phosphate thymidylyltransferase